MKVALLVTLAAGLAQHADAQLPPGGSGYSLHGTAPVIIHRVEPMYTKAALAAKTQGRVVLSTRVGVDGIPSDIAVERGLEHGLNQKAIECLQQWRFKPAVSEGKPVPVKILIGIDFRLPAVSK